MFPNTQTDGQPATLNAKAHGVLPLHLVTIYCCNNTTYLHLSISSIHSFIFSLQRLLVLAVYLGGPITDGAATSWAQV